MITAKKLFLFIIFISMIALTPGCSNREEEVVEITLIHGWGSMEENHEAMRRIYKDFEKKHPEIRINMISMPSAIDVISKTGDLLTVGDIPDVIFLAGDGRESIYEFMKEKGYALDLMPYIEEDKKFEENVSPIALNYWTTKEGGLYTISDVLMMSGGYWYNKDLFERAGIKEIPMTWDTWLEACVKLKEYADNSKKYINPMVIDSEHASYLLSALLYDEGSSIPFKMQEEELNIQDLRVRRALLNLEELSSISNVINSFNFRDTLASFNAGESGMYINGVWAGSLIKEDMNIAYAPFPTKKGEGVVAISSGTGYILGNTGDEKRMDASVKFIKYMLSKPVAERILLETGQVPANPTLEITKETAGERLYQAVNVIQNTENIIEVPANIWGTVRKDIYSNEIISYLSDEISLHDLGGE